MIFKRIFVLCVAICFALPASAEFLPRRVDSASLPVPNAPSAISEAQFRQVIAQIREAYSGVVERHGGRLMMSGDWSNEQIFAGANQVFTFWQVTVTGALARRPELTSDGLALIVCHELGHHLGGFPFRPEKVPVIGVWAANEGEADYFSTQVCARKIWTAETAVNATFRAKASPFNKQVCDANWSRAEEQDLCYRTLDAITSMTNTMAALLKQAAPSLETPDRMQVASTNHEHPEVQCRMDTVLQGAICGARFSEDVIPGKKISAGPHSTDAEQEAARYSCMTAGGYSIGLRPRCWFKPQI